LDSLVGRTLRVEVEKVNFQYARSRKDNNACPAGSQKKLYKGGGLLNFMRKKKKERKKEEVHGLK